MQTHISLSLSLCVFLFFFFFFFFFFFRLRGREKDINPFSSRLPSLFFPRAYARVHARRGYYAARARARVVRLTTERDQEEEHIAAGRTPLFLFQGREKEGRSRVQSVERERETHTRASKKKSFFSLRIFHLFSVFCSLKIAAENLPLLLSLSEHTSPPLSPHKQQSTTKTKRKMSIGLGKGVGIPVKLMHESEGHVITVRYYSFV